MKKNELYQQLVQLAEKLGITVSEQNFRVTSVNARSGLCHIKDAPVFIMDKHLSVAEKVDILTACIVDQPTEDIYIMPTLRDHLDRFSDRQPLLFKKE